MAWYENKTDRHVRFAVGRGPGREDVYDVAPGERCQGPGTYEVPFKREGLTLIAPDDQEPERIGPTFEEWVAAGYQAHGYPPQGYEERDSEGLRAYRKQQAEAAPPPGPEIVTEREVAFIPPAEPVSTVTSPERSMDEPPRHGKGKKRH